MKSCTTCNRTFDDTMTFCLVDGSILSAPFNPHAKEVRPATLPSEPPETRLLNELEPARAAQTSANEQPPITVASDISLPVTTDIQSNRGSSPFVAQPSPMKTIIAPAPEPIIREPNVAALPRSEVLPGRRRSLYVVAALAVGAVVVAGLVWLVQRNRSRETPAASSSTTEKTPKSRETAAASS